MREIKFRYWDKRFGKFQDAGYMFGPDGPQFPTEYIIPMRYTDLHDKNDKEIYEDDILREGGELYVVTWLNEPHRYGFYAVSPKNDTIFMLNLATEPPKSSEVIGNVYENSELLK